MNKAAETYNSSTNAKKALSSFLFSLVGESAPGVCAAVCTQNEVLFSFCEGDRQIYPEKKPLLPSTLFDAASLTKVLATTMIACRFYEKKLFSFTDTVEKFFPFSTIYKDTTILQLLTHSGGFIAEKRLWDCVSDPDDVIDLILKEEPIYKAGTDVVYSCFGFIVLGKILEKIGSASLHTLAEEEVFLPLEMSDTGFLPPPTKTFASTEIDSNTGLPCSGIVHDENARFLKGVSGNAGVFTTLHDCITFSQMLLSNGKTKKGSVFLSENTVAMFNTEFSSSQNERRGLGFKLISGNIDSEGKNVSPTAYGHTGFTGTSMMIDPTKQLSAILFTNRVHPTRENTKILHQRGLFHDLAWGLSS